MVYSMHYTTMNDIHTHLYWESYDSDRDAVIQRAHEAGIEKMFVIGCTTDESRQSVELADKYPELFASVGIHPHFFNELVEKKFLDRPQSFNEGIQKISRELREIAQHKKVVAIGECGLDYFSHDPKKTITIGQKNLQKEGFLAQISLAEELKLPLIIHCRPSAGSQDAYEDLFDILRNYFSASTQSSNRGDPLITHSLSCVLHCYMGDTEITKKFLGLLNIHFSFTGNITYPIKKIMVGTKDDLTETIRIIPLNRIFIETDCPFLAPQDKRGERNEPAFVVFVAEKIAEIKGISREEVESVTTMSVQSIFTL